MARETYDDALARLLRHEGGYTNHPSDPGGPTNFGITIEDYRRYVKPDATAADVRAMRLDEAKTIYRTKYWAALRCDELPAGLDYALFDYGVNSGTGRAARVLQRVLGFADDGRISDALVAAVRKRNSRDLIARLCDERLAFLKRLKTWPVFGAGWGRRVAEVRAAALAIADKARPALAKRVDPLKPSVQNGTAGGIVVAGAGAAAAAAHQAGIPVGIVVAGLIVILALAAGGWLAWRRWKRRRQLAPD